MCIYSLWKCTHSSCLRPQSNASSGSQPLFHSQVGLASIWGPLSLAESAIACIYSKYITCGRSIYTWRWVWKCYTTHFQRWVLVSSNHLDIRSVCSYSSECVCLTFEYTFTVNSSSALKLVLVFSVKGIRLFSGSRLRNPIKRAKTMEKFSADLHFKYRDEPERKYRNKAEVSERNKTALHLLCIFADLG